MLLVVHTNLIVLAMLYLNGKLRRQCKIVNINSGFFPLTLSPCQHIEALKHRSLKNNSEIEMEKKKKTGMWKCNLILLLYLKNVESFSELAPELMKVIDMKVGKVMGAIAVALHGKCAHG